MQSIDLSLGWLLTVGDDGMDLCSLRNGNSIVVGLSLHTESTSNDVLLLMFRAPF